MSICKGVLWFVGVCVTDDLRRLETGPRQGPKTWLKSGVQKPTEAQVSETAGFNGSKRSVGSCGDLVRLWLVGQVLPLGSGLGPIGSSGFEQWKKCQGSH